MAQSKFDEADWTKRLAVALEDVASTARPSYSPLPPEMPHLPMRRHLPKPRHAGLFQLLIRLESSVCNRDRPDQHSLSIARRGCDTSYHGLSAPTNPSSSAHSSIRTCVTFVSVPFSVRMTIPLVVIHPSGYCPLKRWPYRQTSAVCCGIFPISASTVCLGAVASA